MTLDVAFGLVGLAVLLGGAFATFDGVLFLWLAYSATLVGLAGWLLSRWPTRRRWLLWAVVAYEVCLLVLRLVLLVIDSDLTWLRMLHPNTLFPVAIIVMMLLPAARRWFQK